MEKYIKLGEKASSFFDPITRFGISGKQVKEIFPSQLKNPRIKRFIQGGGLVYATKEEFKEYEASLKNQAVPVKTKVEAETPKKDLEGMTKNELYDYVKKSGWEESDIETALAIEKKSDLLSYIKETESLYAPE